MNRPRNVSFFPVCDVLDARGQIIGCAFLELAGYASNLAGRLREK